MSALLELTSHGRWGDPNPTRLQRLGNRGFLKKREEDRLQVTMKGRAALLFGRRWRRPGTDAYTPQDGIRLPEGRTR